MPMVSGDGPRDEPKAVRNSRLPTLSARDIDEFDGLTRPRAAAASERRDGGRGIAMLLAEVGVGICRLILLTLAEAGADTLRSPISEKMSPKSVYLQWEKAWRQLTHDQRSSTTRTRTPTYLDVFDTDSVGLCNGAYGCDAVGVDEFDWPGL